MNVPIFNISVKDSWIAQLYEKFRNERRKLQTDPEVVQKKKRASSPNTTENDKNKLSKRGELNWDPPFAEGEDEASINLHKEFLRAEWQKRARDEENIAQRMEMTYIIIFHNSKLPLVYAE